VDRDARATGVHHTPSPVDEVGAQHDLVVRDGEKDGNAVVALCASHGDVRLRAGRRL
jgi:hypothetical protein